jgi:acyl-CoA reductase-like NAD-dependent aldehyde dehydrogenase
LSSRGSSKATPARTRLKALPWAAALQAAAAIGERWRSLSPRDRQRLAHLLRERLRLRKGRLGELSSKERDELRKLMRKLDLKSMGKDMFPLLRSAGRRKRR